MISQVDLTDLLFFEGLNPEQLELIAKKFDRRTYTRGTILFMEGQETDGTYIIASGLVKVVRLHKDGREKTLAILSRGDLLGEMTLFDNFTRSATVETMEETTLLLISNDDLKQLLLAIPELALRIIQVLSLRMRQANQQIQELIFLNARSRIICNLVHLGTVHGIEEKGHTKISLRLTHAELANLVGVSRETTTKVLDDLQKDNLIQIRNKQLWLLNMSELYRQGMMNL